MGMGQRVYCQEEGIMSTIKSSLGAPVSHWRLVTTLAGKDIVDAIKTKASLTTIVISLLMVLFYRYFPVLTASSDRLDVFLYAEAPSVAAEALQRSPLFAVYDVDSRARLLNGVRDAESVELAIMITPETAAQEAAGGPLTIDGYLMYWIDDTQRAEIREMVETDLSAELGRPVTLNLAGHDIYFDADAFFFVFSATIALLFVTLMIGISVIPNLMIEEKKNKTLEMLRVSPARPWHLVAGKAIAGMFYGLLGSALVFYFFRHLILQWPLAITASVMSILFMVAVGLLLGSIVNNLPQLQLVAWFIILPLLMPIILVALEGLVPAGAVAVMNWIPTVMLAKLFRLSLTPNVTLAHITLPLTVIAACTLLLLALVTWRVNRE